MTLPSSNPARQSRAVDLAVLRRHFLCLKTSRDMHDSTTNEKISRCLHYKCMARLHHSKRAAAPTWLPKGPVPEIWLLLPKPSDLAEVNDSTRGVDCSSVSRDWMGASRLATLPRPASTSLTEQQHRGLHRQERHWLRIVLPRRGGTKMQNSVYQHKVNVSKAITVAHRIEVTTGLAVHKDLATKL